MKKKELLIIFVLAVLVTWPIDISDGLTSSIYQLSDLNDVGFQLNFEKTPAAALRKW